MRKYFKEIIRWILTILLLWQVFIHSHWSVGVCITLIFISFELIGYAVKVLCERIK